MIEGTQDPDEHADDGDYQRMHLTFARGGTRARREHRAIVAAAVRRETKLAAQLMRDHILHAGRDIVAAIGSYREPALTRGSAGP